MSVTQLSTPRSSRDLDDEADKGGPRLIASRRRSLPGSRSVVGGLLVLVAVLLAWWAASGATSPRASRSLSRQRRSPRVR